MASIIRGTLLLLTREGKANVRQHVLAFRRLLTELEKLYQKDDVPLFYWNLRLEMAKLMTEMSKLCKK